MNKKILITAKPQKLSSPSTATNQIHGRYLHLQFHNQSKNCSLHPHPHLQTHHNSLSCPISFTSTMASSPSSPPSHSITSMASSPNHFNQSSAVFNSQATAVSLSNFSTMSSPLCRSRLHHKPKPQLPRRSSQTLCHSSIQKLKSSPLLQFRAHQPPLIHALTPRSPDATAEPRSSAASAAKLLGVQPRFNHHLLNSETPQSSPVRLSQGKALHGG